MHDQPAKLAAALLLTLSAAACSTQRASSAPMQTVAAAPELAGQAPPPPPPPPAQPPAAPEPFPPRDPDIRTIELTPHARLVYRATQAPGMPISVTLERTTHAGAEPSGFFSIGVYRGEELVFETRVSKHSMTVATPERVFTLPSLDEPGDHVLPLSIRYWDKSGADGSSETVKIGASLHIRITETGTPIPPPALLSLPPAVLERVLQSLRPRISYFRAMRWGYEGPRWELCGWLDPTDFVHSDDQVAHILAAELAPALPADRGDATFLLPLEIELVEHGSAPIASMSMTLTAHLVRRETGWRCRLTYPIQIETCSVDLFRPITRDLESADLRFHARAGTFRGECAEAILVHAEGEFTGYALLEMPDPDTTPEPRGYVPGPEIRLINVMWRSDGWYGMDHRDPLRLPVPSAPCPTPRTPNPPQSAAAAESP